uniref:Deoxyuridine 5'-triphosphate nucleotidohydrolase n=1 Tax=Tetranychus urticae TaxID=32264 RepID=T1KDM8_TETUR
MSLKVKIISRGVSFSSVEQSSFGLSLYCLKKFEIKAKGYITLKTGICVGFDEGYYGQVVADCPPSALITAVGGIIKPNNRSEVEVVLFNLGRKTFTARKGERIAQLIVKQFSNCERKKVRSLYYNLRAL